MAMGMRTGANTDNTELPGDMGGKEKGTAEL
jgi:hypothetical protein